ncbi:gustatory receptor for sugar taste 64f [Manduca sexta]|uniref:gustatory receptor for sugar taste 64f n=1 Tax=Manduca sexta TaxID=7130 RepID=UPI00188EDC76|nr:gustatory receptor for sugar taste 64f [Manduca sexta]
MSRVSDAVKKIKLLNRNDLERRLNITNKWPCSLHSTIRHTLLCSRLLGLLPLSGLMKSSSGELRFTFRSIYTIYYLVTLFGQTLMFVMTCCWLVQNGISLPNITNSVFYSSSLISSLILLNIGRFWPKLITKAEEIESTLPPFTSNVTLWCNITMVFTLAAALVEHLLSVFYGLTVAYSCNPKDMCETFFRFNMPWIFDYTPYTLWKGILSEIFNLQSTFIWSYNDLLLMVISIYLTEHFTVHNELLKIAVKEENFSCAEFRTQYLKIVRLVRLINGQFGIYILTSFGINLYWICTQLFYSLKRTQTGHFIACQYRNAHNFMVLQMFFCKHYPYLLQVERFIAQINNIKVALSGLDFFYVTRKMILTLLGTIVTYELVLLQFNK